MLRRALLLPLALLAMPAFAEEFKCEGAFAADSSADRLIELYGQDSIVTGETDGPEGSTVVTTTVFGNDPEKTMVFGWWDEAAHRDLSYVELPATGTVAGLAVGMTVAEVEALKGEPFTMTGFWWDYGGYAGFQSGRLAEIPGGCHLSVYFQPSIEIPPGLDTEPVSGDREVPSSEPLLEKLAVKIEAITIGYPFPGMEDEGADTAPAEAAGEDTRG
jgi:hypothetical protein